MEQYRNQIDEILAKTGVDYRWAQDAGFGPSRVGDQLTAWAYKNRGDPLAQKILANPQGYRDSLIRAVRRLREGGSSDADAGLFNDIQPGGPTASSLEAGGTVAGPETPQGDPREAQFRDYMTKFINRMNSQLTPDDPMYKQLTQLSQMGASRASQDVGGRGLRVGRGGLGELAIQQGAQNAVAPFEMQRAQMAQQAMGMLNSGNMGWEQMRQGAHSLALQEQGMQNQLNQAQYAQDADRAGGMGGLVGGIIGGGVGGLAALATGGAAAPLIPGLVQGGAAVGGSLGQSGVMRPRFGAVPRYRYGGGGGQGGGYA